MPESAADSLLLVACLKLTVDVNALRMLPGSPVPDLEHAPMRISDFDECAIEEAVRMKERHGGRAVGVSVLSRPAPRELLLRALAMGLDEIRIVHAPGEPLDPLMTAAILAKMVGALPGWRVVFCGEGSVDEYNCQAGARLAQALDVPCVACASRIALDGHSLRADRTLEDRVERVECPLPCVVTVAGEACTPRLPSVLQILGAGRRPIVEMDLHGLLPVESLRALRQAGAEWRDTFAPAGARRGIRLEGGTPEEAAAVLVRLLEREGSVHS